MRRVVTLAQMPRESAVMNPLRDNPIANMYGPDFLVLYGVVIALTLGICYWLLPNQIDSLSLRGEHGLGEHGLSPVYQMHDQVLDACTRIRFVGALVIGGLGGYKLIIALMKGQNNVFFLILMGVISIGTLFKICAVPIRESQRQ